MGLFGFFGKKAETHKKSAEREPSELDDCLGIKVEVSAGEAARARSGFADTAAGKGR